MCIEKCLGIAPAGYMRYILYLSLPSQRLYIQPLCASSSSVDDDGSYLDNCRN